MPNALLHDRLAGARLDGLDFNRHTRAHLLRAAQEGIVFALHHGVQMMRGLGLGARTVRAAASNLFLSPLFCSAFATLNDTRLELHDTDGAQGAARAAGLGVGLYRDLSEALCGQKQVAAFAPEPGALPGVPGGLRALVLRS